jgi:hypothetical protein
MKRSYLIVIAVLVSLVAVAVRVYLVGDSWKWAELRLMSVDAAQDGQVTIRLTARQPSGVRIESVQYVDGVPVGRGNYRYVGVPFATSAAFEVTTFSLNPEHAPVSGSFTNSELFGRLRMQVGETRRIQVREPFSLYDFNVGGKRYQCVYRVIAGK